MTIKDLSERLGIGRDNATCLMKSQDFPAIRVGRRWLVDEKEYEKWYATHHGVTIPTRATTSTPRRRKRRISLVANYPATWRYEKKDGKQAQLQS